MSDSSPERTVKKAKYSSEWQAKWEKQFTWLVKSVSQRFIGHCKLCSSDINYEKTGKAAFAVHASSKKHLEKFNISQQATSITDFFHREKCETFETQNAELLFANYLVEHNIPFAASDHSAKLFQKMFPDSKIAKNFTCGRKKALH